MFFRLMPLFCLSLSLPLFFFVGTQLLQACHFAFYAGARNCRVYEAHSIASSTSSRRSPTAIEKTLRGACSLVYRARDYLRRCASPRVSRLVLSPCARALTLSLSLSSSPVYRLCKPLRSPECIGDFYLTVARLSRPINILLAGKYTQFQGRCATAVKPRPWNRSIRGLRRQFRSLIESRSPDLSGEPSPLGGEIYQTAFASPFKWISCSRKDHYSGDKLIRDKRQFPVFSHSLC